MQNFTTQHLRGIRQDGLIYLATGDGRVAFIDASDIAAVAVEALTVSEAGNGEVILTGPEALSYDDVARVITEQTRHEVRHRRLSEEELARQYHGLGLPPDYAHTLAAMDAPIARGEENRVTDAVQRHTGRPPTSFGAFIAAHGSLFRSPPFPG